MKDYKAEVVNTNISDHYTQKFSFQINETTKTKTSYTRFFDKDSIEDFKTKIEEEKWLSVYNTAAQNVNEKWEKLIATYVLLFDECFPKKLIRTPNRTYTPFNDKELEECKKELDIQYDRKYKDQYDAVKKKYDHLLMKAKSTSYEKRIINSDNKQRTMWAICNEIRGTNTSTGDFPKKGDPLELANAYNN